MSHWRRRNEARKGSVTSAVFLNPKCFGTRAIPPVLSLVLSLWACSPTRAQSVYGSIVGRVSEVSGAVVKDASVTITPANNCHSVWLTFKDAQSAIEMRPETAAVDLQRPYFVMPRKSS